MATQNASLETTNSLVDFKLKTPRLWLILLLLFGISAALANLLFYIQLGEWSWLLIQQQTKSFSLLLFMILLLRFLITFVTAWVGGRISVDTRLRARSALLQKTAMGGPDKVRDHGIGSLHTLLYEKVEHLDAYYGLYIPQLFTGILAPLTVITYICFIDSVTGFILLATIPPVPLLLGAVQNRFRVVGKAYGKASADVTSLYLESIRQQTTLKLFNKLHSYGQLLRQKSAVLRSRTIRLLAVNQLALLLVELFFSLVVIVVATWIAIVRFQAGALPAGLAFVMPFVAIELTRPINLVGAFFFAGAIGRQSRKDILAFVNEPEPTQTINLVKNTTAEAGLSINNVVFAYPSHPDRRILQDLTIQIQIGDIVGLAGPSGIGKSTVAKLCCKLYSPQQGTISIDGHELSSLSQSDRAKLLSYLPQRPYLFANTLRHNLCLANPDASDELIDYSIKATGLSELVERLPNKLNTLIGEDGATVSGGERSRIGLARAIIAGSRYLILDEPSAQIDSLVEAGIWKHLRELSNQMGILIIAHRQSTLDACDRVINLPAIQNSEEK